MSRVYDVRMFDPSRAPDLSPPPSFGLWNAIIFLDQFGTSLSKADEVIFGHWNDYADKVINMFHQMIRQTDELVFSNDEYTDLVRILQAFPHRPNLAIVLADKVYDECDGIVDMVAHQVQTPVQKVWSAWAVRVEAIYRELVQKMGRCKLRPAKLDEADFGSERLFSSSDLPKTEGLTDLLHKILDSSSEPEEQPENPKTGLEAHMQRMGF